MTGIILGIFGAWLALALVVGIIYYVFTSLCISKALKSLKSQNAVLAWVPILRTAELCQATGLEGVVIFGKPVKINIWKWLCAVSVAGVLLSAIPYVGSILGGVCSIFAIYWRMIFYEYVMRSIFPSMLDTFDNPAYQKCKSLFFLGLALGGSFAVYLLLLGLNPEAVQPRYARDVRIGVFSKGYNPQNQANTMQSWGTQSDGQGFVQEQGFAQGQGFIQGQGISQAQNFVQGQDSWQTQGFTGGQGFDNSQQGFQSAQQGFAQGQSFENTQQQNSWFSGQSAQPQQSQEDVNLFDNNNGQGTW